MAESAEWFIDDDSIPHPPGPIEATELPFTQNPSRCSVTLWADDDWRIAQNFAHSIKALDLIGHGLKDLPKTITAFENLEYLRVREPKPYYEAEPPEVSGPAYPESGHFLWRLTLLPKLHTLILKFHGLRDLTDCIGELWNLRNLRIDDFEGHRLPLELSQLSDLEVLVIRGGLGGIGLDGSYFRMYPGSQLQSLPEQLANLAKLRRLVLRKHRLSKWPQALCQFKKLEHLDLSENQLLDLPDEFSEMQSLRSLKLNNNQLSKIPACIFELKDLERLDLSGNPLKRIPDEICRLENLKTLFIDWHRIKTFVDKTRFFLSDRNLIPSEFDSQSLL